MDIESTITNLRRPSNNVSAPRNDVYFDVYLKNIACKKVTVTVTRLSAEIIQLWSKTHWSQLDPYSDLENETVTKTTDKSGSCIGSSDLAQIEAPQSTNPVQTIIGGHVLQKRKRHYNVDRPCRGGAHKFYRDMCLNSTRIASLTTGKRSVGLKSPSIDRIRAQATIKEINRKKRNSETVNVRLTRSYKLFQPIRRLTKETSSSDPDSDYADSDDTIILPVVATEPALEKLLSAV